MLKSCVGCKQEFHTEVQQKKYCSLKCREKLRGNEKTCKHCNKKYIGRKGREFCGMLCFGLFHKETIISRNLRNRKYPKVDGLSRQKVFWLHNPEARKKDLARDTNKREQLIQYLGGRCVRCGYQEDIRALELDHKNNDGDKDRRLYGTKIARFYIKNLARATERLQVLCANCNKIKAVVEREHAKSRRTKFIYKES